jgi:hypothetical protein
MKFFDKLGNELKIGDYLVGPSYRRQEDYFVINDYYRSPVYEIMGVDLHYLPKDSINGSAGWFTVHKIRSKYTKMSEIERVKFLLEI